MFLNQAIPPPFLKGWSVIFFGGDVNVGRRTNWNLHKKPFGNLPAMVDADLRIVNLECVVAAQGKQGIGKGEGGPYYYHARPEQTNLLSEAKIDVALTANNHSLNFYEAALLEQNNYLDRAGVLHLGTGKNLDEATRPLFLNVRGIVVALFNVDATMKPFAATADKPGTFYLPPDKPEFWQKFFTEKIADARKKADVVLVAPHWGINFVEEPMEHIKTLGRLLIDCGADAVLGCHSHVLHGVETYNDRPIIYDAGNFFWDEKPKSGGAFSLVISKRGVEQLFFASFITDRSKISPATAVQSKPFCQKFLDACRKLNSEGKILASDLIEFKFEPPPREAKTLEPVEISSSRRGEIIPAMTEPLPEWTPDKVPDDAAIEPQQFGEIKLIGCRVSPEIFKRRQMLYAETWWMLDEPIDKDLTFQIRGVPAVKGAMPNFGAGMDHQGCDWLWPTNRWKSGVIYYERFGLRPPGTKELVNVDVSLQVAVLEGKTALGKYIHPKKIQLQIPNRPTVTPEVVKPEVSTPKVSTSEVSTPEVVTSEVSTPEVSTPEVSTPEVSTPEVSTPKVSTPEVSTPEVSKPEVGKPEVSTPEAIDLDEFKREFKAENGVVFFMLRHFSATPAGLELSALRRATLFKNYLGCDVFLLTNEYQNTLFENFAEYNAAGTLINLYDYFQEIDRATFKPRTVYIEPKDADCKIERVGGDLNILRGDGSLSMQCIFTPNQRLNYINYFNESGKKFQRDSYDTLGFLSRRQILDTDSETPVEEFYYKPDGTVAIKMIYEIVDKKSARTSIELVGKNITVDHSRKLIRRWLENLTADKNHKYFLIGDRSPEYTRFYTAVKELGLKNIFVLHQIHNIHVLENFDPMTATTKRWYNFLTDQSFQSDAIITLTAKTTSIKPEPYKVVIVGRVSGRRDNQKNPEQAIEAFELVHKKLPQATLHFYGPGNATGDLKAMIKSAGLTNSVIFEGFVKNMDEVYSSAACSILTSRFEGFSLVVQESLQNNCPVVSFDCNYGPSDMIADGVNGYLVPLGDVEAMADRIIKILTEPRLRDKLSANCEQSIEKFSPEVVARQWAELFRRLMKGA